MPQESQNIQQTTPPLPAGYTLDQNIPPLPSGYTLDASSSGYTPDQIQANIKSLMPDAPDLLVRNILANPEKYRSVMPQLFQNLPTNQAPGFWSTLGSDLKGYASVLSPVNEGPQSRVGAFVRQTATENQQMAAENAARQKAGYSNIYRAIAPVAEYGLGVNAPGMEQAAATGNTAAVAGHAVAPLALTASTEAVGHGLPATISKISDVIPSASRAGAALGEVKTVAGSVPIDMSAVGDTALDLYTQSQRGATLPKVVRDFVNRATKPDADPITYDEAKDFQSNVSRLSANERMNLNPNTQRLLGQLNANLKDSLQDAADTVDKGQQFTQAMQEYHHAMQLRGLTDEAKQILWKAALGGVGVGAGSAILKAVLGKQQP